MEKNTDRDHLEQNYTSNPDHADNVASGLLAKTSAAQKKIAGSIPVVGDIVGQLPSVNDIASGILGGKHEDTSLTGYKNFVAGYNQLPFYPTKDEMQKAAISGKWDGTTRNGIAANYDPSTGHFSSGDWNFQVTGLSPISIKSFKGTSESHSFTSGINAATPLVANTAVKIVDQNLGTKTTVDSSTNVPAETKTVIDPISGQPKNINTGIPKLYLYIGGGVLAVVIIIAIIWIAKKK